MPRAQNLKLLRQLAAFGAVGLINTAVGLAVIFACMDWLGWQPLAANVAGYAIGLVISFSLNGRLTFGQSGLRAATFARFLAVFAVSYAANAALVVRLSPIDRHVAQIVGLACYTLLNFVGCKLFVFRAP